MRFVARDWLVAVVLLVAVLAIIGWRYTSKGQEHEPARTTSAEFSAEIVQRSPPQADADRPLVQYAMPMSLGDTGVLRGRVVDAVTKAPIREFTIEFFARDAQKPTPGAREFQSKDGRFEWASVPAGLWEITASAPGYQRFEVGEVSIRKGVTTTELVLPLRRGFSVTGRVFDEVTSAGIENATVSFRDAQSNEFDRNWRRRERSSTDRNGSFVLNGVPAGRITISADAQDHAGKSVTVSVGPDLAPLQIALSAGSLISGQLTAADGITGTVGWIHLADLDRGTGGGARSGPNGEFIYKNMPAGRYRLMGRSEFGIAELDLALAPNERRENIVLALKGGSTIRGAIIGLSAADLSRTSLSVRREGDSMDLLGTRIDPDGNFEARGLKAGRTHVIVDVADKLQVSRVVHLPPDGEITVDFNFARGARLSGRITRNGKPWSRVAVSADPAFDQSLQVYPRSTSSQGLYAFDTLPYGDYRLMVGRYRTSVVRVDGDKEFDVDVPAAANFEGQVSENPSGAPIVGARIDLYPSEAMTKLLPYSEETDHFGRFSVANVLPGDYIVTVYKTDFEIYRERMSFGTVTEHRELRLPPDRGIRVHVRTASGAAIKAVRVSERYGRGISLRLDEEGSAYLPRGLAGSSLAFAAVGFEPIEVRAWDGRELELRFVPSSAQR